MIGNMFLIWLVTISILLFKPMNPRANRLSASRSDSLLARGETQSRSLYTGIEQFERSSTEFHKLTPLKVEVLSIAIFDPSFKSIPACEDCMAITVAFSVTCTRVDGCTNLSVMDFYVTYDSAFPTLFYGDEFPNPALQGEAYAEIVYGAQKEFTATDLAQGEMTAGELIFIVKPDASNFELHYHEDDAGQMDPSVTLEEEDQ